MDRFAIPTALVALGISWPILQLVGQAPPFFIARHSPVLDIVVFGVAIGVLVPVVAGLIAVVPGRLGRLAWFLFSAIGLIGLSVPISRAVNESDVAWVAAATAFAVGGTLLAERSATFRSLCRLLFDLAADHRCGLPRRNPVGQIGLRATCCMDGCRQHEGAAADGPFVLVVFDEFSTASIVHTDGTLRSERYPGSGTAGEPGNMVPEGHLDGRVHRAGSSGHPVRHRT